MNKPELTKTEGTLFVFWQDPINRRWHVVGRLTRLGGEYRFAYTRGATASPRFIPFGRMSNLNAEYRSTDLLPLFSNRILPRSRPEYFDYLRWMALDASDADPLTVLGRSGGLKSTDSLAIYPLPTRDEDGEYRVLFFCHGLRYSAENALARIAQLGVGDRLYPMHDMQNPMDQQAIALRSDDPAAFLGYCPRFFARDFRTLLQRRRASASITVVRVNTDAPIEFRLLCEFRSPWPAGFHPCDGEEYEVLAEKLSGEPVDRAASGPRPRAA